ncbi:GNAT family N-acetyltransferase [Listeria rustica]|uniref:GNAT family N-acetyltransferase n=1 Tax=Listeria rustica TaxID=2713503 RepID=A0A7W1YH66_9LIST|nr:GNAT family protein [Listeria rustica]MBA3927363.1 GNAT family N-acetyltransferase [Listeria rustica]
MESYTYLLAENQIIKTERLILRPITLADAKAMFDYASDEETTRFVFDTHQTIDTTRQSIAEFFIAAPIGKYGIEIAETSKFIGTIDIRVDQLNKSGCLGYALNKSYWGNGYMTEAGFAMLDLAFKTLELERVTSLHDVRNPASGNVMKRLGMTYEGTLRKNRFVKKEFVDDAHYSILKEEYQH